MSRPSSSDWLDEGLAEGPPAGEEALPVEPFPPLPEDVQFEAGPDAIALEPEPEPAKERRGIFGWAQSVVLGVRDTWDDVLDEGRRGAREDYQERWREFESKTKYRRRRNPRA